MVQNHLRSHGAGESVIAEEASRADEPPPQIAPKPAPLPRESNGNGNGVHVDPPPAVTDPKGVVDLVVAAQHPKTRDRAAMIGAILSRAGWAIRERAPDQTPCGVPLA
jgi:hypothetical protein